MKNIHLIILFILPICLRTTFIKRDIEDNSVIDSVIAEINGSKASHVTQPIRKLSPVILGKFCI